MPLPHRVSVKSRRNPWKILLHYWTCPGCDIGSAAHTGWTEVQNTALFHAATCAKLRDLNLKALRCWNCDGRGVVNNGWCVVCIGDGWTREPRP